MGDLAPARAALRETPRDAPAARDGLVLAVALSSALAWGLVFVARLDGLAVAGALAALAGLAALRRRRELATLALTTAVVSALAAVPGLVRLWPAPLLLAVAAGLAVSRFRAPWLERGELVGRVVGWVLLVVALSAGALVAWWAIVRPDLSDLPALPAGPHPALLAAGVVAWAMCNAAAEELYFRGALQHELVRALGRGGVLVQAVAFGLMHYRGFPRGWAGVGLATIYGIMMSALRRRSGGLLAPWVAHVLADLVVVAIRVVALG